MLTSKQENYCKNRAIEEMTQKDAYIHAYNTENMSEASIYVAASRLEANANIALRIKELEGEKTADILKEKKWTRDNAYTELTWLIEQAKNEIKNTNSVSGSVATAIINSVKELNGIYAVAEKTEGGGVLEDILQAVRGIDND